MSLPGFVAAGVGSAAGGSALFGAIAVNFAGNALAAILILSLGALMGSLVGWFYVKARGALPEGYRSSGRRFTGPRQRLQ